MAFSAAGFPAQLDHLFEAVVPVVDKEPGNQDAGLQDALLAVLVKLTGQQDIAENPATAGLQRRARTFLQRYTYEERDLPPDPEDIFGQPVREILLHAWFDAAALQRELRLAGLPLWGRERPTTLLWLAFEADGNRLLFSNSPEQNIATFISEHGTENPVEIIEQSITAGAARRGLPVQLPRLDDIDKSQLGFADVWGGFSERILVASERYRTYGVIAGNIFYAGDDRWSARWVLYSENGETQWQVLADSLTAAIDSGIDGVADAYGKQFAVDSAVAGSARISLEVHDVATLSDYARVLDYLENLSMVQAGSVNRVFDSKLAVELRVLGAETDLEQAIAIGSTLVSVETMEMAIDLDNPDSVQLDHALKYLLVH